jgi:pimeloyl-ACP methyl ester carboxylesterase
MQVRKSYPHEENTMNTNVSRRQVLAAGAALAGSAAVMASPLGTGAAAAATAGGGTAKPAKPTIVLVHGGYADSSCWNGTIQVLQDKGYTTIAGSNPLRGIPTDAPYIGSLLEAISGPVVLVAHSMGGTVITNAAAGKSNVKALVYVAAFVPDVGETQGELINKFPGSEVLPVSVPVPYTKADGTTGTDLYLSKDGQAAFAADIPTGTFRLLQATQRPFDADSFSYPTTAAAWHTIPSWGLVAGRDKAIPPAAERWMYGRANARKVIELPTSSHVAMISHPRVVADLIDDAAEATG